MAFERLNSATNSYEPSDRYSFDDKGQTLEGHLVDAATLTSKSNGKPFKKYTIKPSKGPNVSFLGSHQLDGPLSKVVIGQYVRIVFNGVKKLGGGKTIKLFDIDVDRDNTLKISSTETKKTAADIIASARA